MGYFSNGTEGEIYESDWCARCVHLPDDPDTEGCAVWFLHLMHNYDECNKSDSFLHVLIPREGIRNGQCRMFYERPAPKFDPKQRELPFECEEG